MSLQQCYGKTLTSSPGGPVLVVPLRSSDMNSHRCASGQTPRCVMLCTVLMAVLAGCGYPDLGRCNETEANRIVYDQLGTPFTQGQALLHASCGQGAFCHSAGAKGRDRYGVPAGLDFDMMVISGLEENDTQENERRTNVLRAGFVRAYDYRLKNHAWIEDDTMPPGAIGQRLLDESPDFFYDDNTIVPKLDARQGRSAMRNWLACSPPLAIVERTQPHPDPNYVGFGMLVAAREVELPEPTWNSIHSRMSGWACTTSGCHGQRNIKADLSLADKDLAYEALVGQPATTSGDAECGQSGLLLVAPGDPDNSLLVIKLENRQECGEAMPIGSSRLPSGFIAPIREWIAQGAPNN